MQGGTIEENYYAFLYHLIDAGFGFINGGFGQ